MHYSVRVQDDMGHIYIYPEDANGLPKHVSNIVYEKMKLYTECYGFTDTFNGRTFHGRGYRMKPGYQKCWTYDCGEGDQVVIEFLL